MQIIFFIANIYDITLTGCNFKFWVTLSVIPAIGAE